MIIKGMEPFIKPMTGKISIHRSGRRPRIFWLLLGGGIFLFLLPLLFYLPSVLKDTDEKRIAKQFYKGQKAVLTRDYPLLEQILSEKYEGSVGLSKKEAMEIAKYVLSQIEDLDVTILTLEITLEDTSTARAHSIFEYSGYWMGSNIYNRVPLSGGVPRDVPGVANMVFTKDESGWLIMRLDLVLNGYMYK